MKKITYAAMGVIILFTSCWNKQKHEVLEPEIPRFDITGFVMDVDSGEPLQNAVLALEVITLFHETEFEIVSDTTDSIGSYSFKAIVPGRYNISVVRDTHYVVVADEIVQQYEHRTLDFKLPKVLRAAGFYSIPTYPAFQGIHWKYPSTCAGVIVWRPDDNFDSRFSAMRVEEGNFRTGFNVVGTKKYNPENPDFHGLTFLSNYWTISVDEPGYVYEVNPGDSRVMGKIKTSWEMSDLTTDGSHLWAATSSGKILKFGKHPTLFLQEFQRTDEHLSGIAWDGENIWTYAPDENLLMKRDAAMNTIETYRPVVIDNTFKQVDNAELNYLCFDHYGCLWAATSQGSYKFEKK